MDFVASKEEGRRILKHSGARGYGPIYEDTLFGLECVGWRRKWIELREVPQHAADRLIVAHHYSHKATSNRFLSMGVYFAWGQEMLGAIQLGYGIRPDIKSTFGEEVTGDNSREFDRMWLDDRLPKFSETITLSCLERYLRMRHPEIRFLITYADGSTGRNGTIYKAANYIPMGKIKADFYLLPSGERIHPVTMWHRHATRAWDALREIYPGIKKAEGWQYRFIKDLKPSRRTTKAEPMGDGNGK